MGKTKHGRRGADTEIVVPVGTELWVENGEPRRVADLAVAGQMVVVAKGGRGGRGNARFASPTNRFPLLAEEGDPGDSLKLRLELKLLGDVGIVGAPNVGKSSLLAAVSRARPRIAEYPFTTIEPVLGVVDRREKGFVMVDIPGLIEGAHSGVGLGHQFLRHVERTRVLVHMIDGTADDALGDYRKVRKELGLFHEDLLKRAHIVAVNKMDVPGAAQICGGVRDELSRESVSVHCISAVARQGLDSLLDEVMQILDRVPVRRVEKAGAQKGGQAIPVVSPRPIDKSQIVRKEGDTYVVSLRAAERLAAMVDGSNWEARVQLYEQLRRLGVIAALEKAGIGPGQAFRIGKLEWEWE